MALYSYAIQRGQNDHQVSLAAGQTSATNQMVLTYDTAGFPDELSVVRSLQDILSFLVTNPFNKT